MITISDQDWLELLAVARDAGARLPTAIVEIEVGRWVDSGSDEPLRAVARRLGRDVANVARARDRHKNAKRNTIATVDIGLTPYIESSRNTTATVVVIPENSCRNTIATLGTDSTNDIESSRNTTAKSNINVYNVDNSLPVLALSSGPFVDQKQKHKKSDNEKNTQSGLFGMQSTDRASLVLQRMVDLFNELATNKTGNARKMRQSGRDALAKRLKHHPETQIESLIRWLATSDHQKAEYLRENGYAYGDTPWSKRHYEDYVEIMNEPQPQRKQSDHDQWQELFDEAVAEQHENKRILGGA